MKLKTIAMLVSSLVFVVPTGFTASAGKQATDRPAANQKVNMAPGKILVKFKGVAPVDTSGPAATAETSLNLPAAAQNVLASIKGSVDKTLAAQGVVRVTTTMEVGPAIEALYRSGAVVYAEPDFLYSFKATSTPNDPDYSKLWGMNNTGQTGGVADADIDAPEAWSKRTNSQSVVVGVIDTGVEYDHPDLAKNMWVNPGEIPGNSIDDDGNGYIDDVYGINTITGSGDPRDDNAHGTHVSGTIGAKGNNANQVVGVSWSAKIMALKFLSSMGSGSSSDAIEAINYAIAMKKKLGISRMVLSNSWGGGGFSQTMYDAIKAAKDAGILFVAAAGNDGRNTDAVPNYPSNYALSNVISVGASDHSDLPAYFSNYGCGTVDIFAPGVGILSTVLNGGTASYNGTSMATPHVAGAAALIWAQNSTKTWSGVKTALLNGGDKKTALKALSVTQARLNVNNAMSSSYFSLPSIWEVSPTSAPPGSEVTITGANFGSTKGSLSFEGKTLTINSWSSSKIVATLPSSVSAKQGELRVKNSSGTADKRGACLNVAYDAVPVGQTILPHGWASGVKVGSDFWIIGGGTYWGQTGLVEKYTPSSKSSSISSTWMMPTPLTNTGAAAIGSKIYVVGGLDWNTSTASKALQIFDTSTGKWTVGKSLPETLVQPNVVALGNGKLYVFGGRNESYSVSTTTYVYTPSSNTWTTAASMPEGKMFASSIKYGSSSSNKAMLMGGATSSYFGYETKTVHVFDASTNTWAAKPDMKQTRAGAAGAYYMSQPQALAGAGSGSTSGEWLNGSTWYEGAKIGVPLFTLMGDSFGTSAYFLGGYDQSLYNYSSTIWKLTR